MPGCCCSNSVCPPVHVWQPLRRTECTSTTNALLLVAVVGCVAAGAPCASRHRLTAVTTNLECCFPDSFPFFFQCGVIAVVGMIVWFGSEPKEPKMEDDERGWFFGLRCRGGKRGYDWVCWFLGSVWGHGA